MYFHWKKQAALDGPCTDMTGFTRMVASEDGKPDGLEDEMPSVFVKQLTTEELSTLGHFGVLNRPYSAVQYIAAGHLDRVAEDYVYIAEVRQPALSDVPHPPHVHTVRRPCPPALLYPRD
eukprot:1215465-Prymnesium_polylepis.1